MNDPNPIIDEGAPTSTGGIHDATELCNSLGITLELDQPRSRYTHGWGMGCADAKDIICSWHLTVHDSKCTPCTISFDLVEGTSPLIIGLDLKQYANTCNLQCPPYISFKRPTDTKTFFFPTYITTDQQGNKRLRMEITTHQQSSISTMMANIAKRPDINLAKKLHKFTHAHYQDMKAILRDAGQLKPSLEEACERVYNACPICASSGRPSDRRKVSITHVNRAFNEEIQTDFTYVRIFDKRYEIINIIDTGTKYGERGIVPSRSAETMKAMFEQLWFYNHGVPKRFSADHEFCRPVLKKFLDSHNIILRSRPSRSSHKCGRIERNHGVFKSILKRIERSDTHATPTTIVARTSFLTNCMKGSKVMSAFQLVRGFPHR